MIISDGGIETFYFVTKINKQSTVSYVLTPFAVNWNLGSIIVRYKICKTKVVGSSRDSGVTFFPFLLTIYLLQLLLNDLSMATYSTI